MKFFYHFILLIFISACAVQGPISGGPVDLDPPELISVYPANFSTQIAPDEKITLVFNEQIDPISAQEAIRISNHDFDVKVKDKKLIISSKEGWSPDFLLDIYIGRALKDYQNNQLDKPLNLFYSLSDYMPSYEINGDIMHVYNTINSIRHEYGLTSRHNPYKGKYEVGLYQELDSGMVLIKKVESDINSQFSFSALTGGVYRVAAVMGDLLDIKTDFRSKWYSISREDITLDSDNVKSDISLFIAKPIRQKEILSIDFINEYWVNYTTAPPQSTRILKSKGVFSEGYYHFIEGESIEGDSVTVILNLFNQFENYNTPPYTFVVPEVVDSDPPEIYSIRSDTTKTYLFFTEPIEITGHKDSIFYVIRDSVDVYLSSNGKKKLFIKNPNDYVTTGVEINQKFKYNEEDSLFYPQDSLIYINRDFIKDLSGNTLEGSILATPPIPFNRKYYRPLRWSSSSFTAPNRHIGISSSDDYKSNKNDYNDMDVSGFGGIYGRVEFKSDVKSMVVIAQSINYDRNFFEAQNLRNNEYFPDDTFAFESLPAGQYILYCYENYEDTLEGYELDSDIMYPYFAGKWDSFEPPSRFSEIMGPIEVRSNWDTKDIVLKLRDSIINHGKLEKESDE